MRPSTKSTGVGALTVALGQGIVALPQAATAAEQDSEVVAGRVTKIDHDRSSVTVQGSDGHSHESDASAETLQDLTVGNRIEAKRRPTTD